MPRGRGGPALATKTAWGPTPPRKLAAPSSEPNRERYGQCFEAGGALIAPTKEVIPWV